MQQAIKGRGASDNPENRFKERPKIDYDINKESGQKPSPKTQLIKDDTKEIISYIKSPDIPFEAGLNPYRGCEHGCIYCYARPYHEYLGFSCGLDFESKIIVKYDAARLLRNTFESKKWSPKVIAFSGITDIYQPLERKLGITRQCLEVLADFRNPVTMITKNHLVTRDIDYLKELSEYNCVRVTVSITSLDKTLTQIMEPRTSRPQKRLWAIEQLANAGIPVGVNVAPIIPGLTDSESVKILEAAVNAGAQHAGYTILRLPWQLKELFSDWLEQHFPDRKEKVLNRLRDMHDGKLYKSNWGERRRGKGNFSKQIGDLFALQKVRLGLNEEREPLTTQYFRRKEGGQMNLFDEM